MQTANRPRGSRAAAAAAMADLPAVAMSRKDRIERLRELIGEGCTTAQIAADLGALVAAPEMLRRLQP